MDTGVCSSESINGEDVFSCKESDVSSADHLVVMVHGILGRSVFPIFYLFLYFFCYYYMIYIIVMVFIAANRVQIRVMLLIFGTAVCRNLDIWLRSCSI